jgi:hypothetical protein
MQSSVNRVTYVEVREMHACLGYVPSWPHSCDMCSLGEKTEVKLQLLVIKNEVSMHELPPLL